MAIDRIGHRSIGIPAGTAAGSAHARPSSDFRTHLAPATPVERPADATPLSRLRSGEINASQYIEMKVDAATAHLQGLPESQREFIRRALTEALEQEPALRT